MVISENVLDTTLEATRQVKEDLVFAYRVMAELQMDDLTYGHLSARVPGQSSFYIYPLGQLFSEATTASLLTVNLDGEVIAGSEMQYNQTGYVIHSAIYRARKDIQAVFHLHTIPGVSVSTMKCGLLPLSQFSFHFYNRMAYHNYDALALDHATEGAKLAADLGSFSAMLLHNHGTLTCGKTIPEAFFYSYYLEKACRVQCKALASQEPLIIPEPAICEKAAQDMRNFEPNLGQRDWQALKRKYRHILTPI